MVLADIANVGPDYLPGHAHADTLSFEMSLNKRRVIVNSGTSVYGVSAERLRQRGTQAHSTLCLGNENSSEVWEGFRVGRRAYVSHVSVENELEILQLGAQHDGYCHLPGSPLHSRNWCLGNSSLAVNDCVTGDGSQLCDIRFYLAPGINAEVISKDDILLTDGEGQYIARVTSTQKEKLSIKKSTWHPEFGKVVSNLCISIRFNRNAPCSHITTFDWSKK